MDMSFGSKVNKLRHPRTK